MKHSSFYSLGVAVVLLLISGALYGGIFFLFGREQGVTNILNQQIATKKTEIARAQQAQTALATLSGDEATIKGYSLSRDQIVGILESLQSTGSVVGATVQVLSVGDDKAAVHPRITVSLLINGTFDAVMKTIGTLENAPYDSSLSNLTLTSAAGKNGAVWSAATVLSLGLQRVSTSTPRTP